MDVRPICKVDQCASDYDVPTLVRGGLLPGHESVGTAVYIDWRTSRVLWGERPRTPFRSYAVARQTGYNKIAPLFF